MKIENPGSGMIRDLPTGTRPEYISDQRNSFTSDLIGTSPKETAEAASETARPDSVAQSQSGLVDARKAVEKLNELAQSRRTNAYFSVDEAADTTVIKVFSTETGELIRQYPPEEILTMKAKLSESIGGLFDTTA